MWTAGHCVGDGSGAFYSDFLFVPGYRNGSKPAGEWVYDQVVTTSQWANAGDFRFDVAALTMAPSGGQKIEEVVGGRGIRFNQPHLQSYEASDILRRRPSTARSCSCASRISAPSPRSATALPQPMGIGCDMTGGSSGGGWVVAGEFVQSVNSFTLDAIEDVIFGPQLGDAALAV